MLRSTAEIIQEREKTARAVPIAWVAGGFLLGLLAAALWSLERSLTPYEPSSGVPASATSSQAFPANSMLSIADQLSGDTVVVARINVPAPGGWAAVLERQGDRLGNVLGAVRVMGPSTDVRIPLLRSTAPRSAYAVVLYRDDGDGEFSLTSDSLYIEYDTGKRVIAPFATR